MNILWKNKKTW